MSGAAHPASISIAVEVPVIDHASDPVHAADPPADPAALAASWLPGPDEDRILMTLSTVSPEGVPHARTVMLSDFDGASFSFHTDASSRKVADLAVNPRVALTILWPCFPSASACTVIGKGIWPSGLATPLTRDNWPGSVPACNSATAQKWQSLRQR